MLQNGVCPEPGFCSAKAPCFAKEEAGPQDVRPLVKHPWEEKQAMNRLAGQAYELMERGAIHTCTGCGGLQVEGHWRRRR